jgi:predicted RNase H-like HicB family nuclease
MHYPLSWPLSRLLSTLGVPLHIEVTFFYDKEAGVFVATSEDIPGLILESESYQGLVNEAEEAIPALLSLNSQTLSANTTADIVFRDHISFA